MTLETLMDMAADEVWFCVVTPDGEEHLFFNADYIGGYEETMKELEPLLDREFDGFDLVIRKDPEDEAEDIVNAEDVPMVWVGLLKTEEELERDRIEASMGEGI